MRIFGSHKGHDPTRVFKVHGQSIQSINPKLYYCSYVPNVNHMTPIVIEKIEKERDELREEDTASVFDTADIFKIFDNLAVVRWHEFDTWRNLIFVGLKLGLTENQIHKLSSKADDKYSERSTDIVINSYDTDKCTITLGTVLFYLKKDVNTKMYFTLAGAELMKRINKRKVDSLFDTSKYANVTTVFPTDKWVTNNLLNSNEKCIVIKAGLGKGKTTASVDHINNTHYDRIIVLTPRKTFAKSVLNRLNIETKKEFVLYSNLKGKDYFISSPNVVIQVESLHRLKIIDPEEKTMILCDEIESILFQMTVTKTHGTNHTSNLDMLEDILTKANKIICLDAFVSSKTLDTLSLMNIPFKFYNFTLPLEQRTCITFGEESGFTGKLIRDLQQNKKIYFFCSSNKKLTEYFLPLIKHTYPTKKVIEYHSKFSSINLTTINDNWKNADMIACTSTITVGCNFDLQGVFDKVYIYANASSKNLVRYMFQSS